MQYWLAPLNVELPDHVGLKGELYPANRRPNFKNVLTTSKRNADTGKTRNTHTFV